MQFVDAKEIDYRYFERPYFIAPKDDLAGEGFVVIRDALRKMNRVGIGQVTIAGREWLIAVAPLGDGLAWRCSATRTNCVSRKTSSTKCRPPSRKRRCWISRRSYRSEDGAVQAGEIREPLPAGVARARRGKRKGKKIISEPETVRTGGNVVDLMEALRKSVEAKSTTKPKAKSSKKSA